MNYELKNGEIVSYNKRKKHGMIRMITMDNSKAPARLMSVRFKKTQCLDFVPETGKKVKFVVLYDSKTHKYENVRLVCRPLMHTREVL